MQAKKKLGQHFLISPGVVDKLVTTGEVTSNDTVIEIGPGTGVLTRALLQTGAHVIAIEKDADLVADLKEAFATEHDAGTFTLIEGDALDAPEVSGPYKVVANIPYYITGKILRTYLGHTHQPTSMTLLMQREVAERIVVRDTKESLLSLAVHAYGVPRYIQTIKPGAFYPKPNVDSAILSIVNISRKAFLNEAYEKFWFTLIRTAFQFKRKTLANNLKGLVDPIALFAFFDEHHLAHDTRAEDIPYEMWHVLCRSVQRTV